MKRFFPLLFLVAGCHGLDCVPFPPRMVPGFRPPPVPWVLMGAPFSSIGPRIGDAVVPSDVSVLVLAPASPSPARAGVPAPVNLRILSQENSAAGEEVMAEMEVPGDPDRTYRIRVQPDGEDVRMLTGPEHVVRGREKIQIPFTTTRPGRGGLTARAYED